MPVRCRPRFPSRNRRFPDRCRSPDCASTAFRCRCLLLRQKLFVLPCRRLRNNYILCPTGTPTFAALRRQRRDLIIANPVEANTPTVAGQAAASASAPENAGTVLLTDSDDRCTPPASTHRQICTCPPRAKGPLDRRSKRLSFPHFFLRRKKCGRRRPPPRQGETDSPPGRRNPPRAKGSLNRRFEWFSLVTFFLQKKKVTRAEARNSPSRARRRNTCPPRAKGPLDRRSKRLSFPHFFLRRKKCGRRRPPPRQGKIDSPPQRRNPPRARRRNTCSPPGWRSTHPPARRQKNA